MYNKKRVSIFELTNIIFLILFSMSILLPFHLVLSQSFMRNDDIIRYGYTLIPKRISLAAYRFLLVDNKYMYRSFGISIFIATVGTLVNLMFTATFAYGLSKKYLPYRKAITFFAFFTMLFGGGLIPTYMIVVGLGMRNSLWALIIPGAINTWNMFIMRNFFMAIPESLEESARIDGANDITILARIILPVSLPAIATIGMFYAVSHWNSWFAAAIYLNEREKWPMQLILREIIVAIQMLADGAADYDHSNTPRESVRAAAVIITSIPIICVYPFAQKYFVRGVMVGSIKG